jgi:peptide/nickel transport system substrate-binding protein
MIYQKKVLTILGLVTLCVASVFANGNNEKATTKADTVKNTVNLEAKESPYLSKLVQSGKLPALESRIPTESDVMVETMDSVGSYSDTLTMNFKGLNDKWKIEKCFEEPLFRFKIDGSIEPNVAKGYDVNEDSTVYKIYLRKGMKWSDGVDFTADDVLFWYEHMMLKKTFGKSIYNCFYSINKDTGEKTLCDMEKIDNYTVQVTFADPSVLFLEKVAIDCKWMFAPAHYYKKILPEFIGEEAAKVKATELGFNDVSSMGKQTGYYYWIQLGRPVLRPWVLSNDFDSDLTVLKRNPYYFKVDSDGKQLPYIDELHLIKYSEQNQNVLKTISGESQVSFIQFSDIVPIQENATKGNYNVLAWNSSLWAELGASIQLNLTAKDDNKRELFQDINFRHALSIAADRTEINKLLANGFASETQASPAKGSQGYSEEWSKKWTEYNPEKAKELLNKTNLIMGDDGYYKFKDGSPFLLTLTTWNNFDMTAKCGELLTEKYYKAIGIKAVFSLKDRSYYDQMADSNDLDATIAPSESISNVNVALRPDSLVPTRDYAFWYGLYGTYNSSNGKDGIKPTGDIAKLVELYNKQNACTNKVDIEKYSEEILKLHEKNIWEIGYMGTLPSFITVNKNIKNFPETSIECDEFRGFGIAHWQNLYFAK